MLREREKIMLEKERGRAFDLVRLFGAFGDAHIGPKNDALFSSLFSVVHTWLLKIK
jgi:hypothetical protein